MAILIRASAAWRRRKQFMSLKYASDINTGDCLSLGRVDDYHSTDLLPPELCEVILIESVEMIDNTLRVVGITRRGREQLIIPALSTICYRKLHLNQEDHILSVLAERLIYHVPEYLQDQIVR